MAQSLEGYESIGYFEFVQLLGDYRLTNKEQFANRCVDTEFLLHNNDHICIYIDYDEKLNTLILSNEDILSEIQLAGFEINDLLIEKILGLHYVSIFQAKRNNCLVYRKIDLSNNNKHNGVKDVLRQFNALIQEILEIDQLCVTSNRLKEKEKINELDNTNRSVHINDRTRVSLSTG